MRMRAVRRSLGGLAACVWLLALLLTGCAAPSLSMPFRSASPAKTATPSLAPVAAKKGGIADAAALPVGATRCADVPEFAQAASVTDAGVSFKDVPLPEGAVGARGGETQQFYTFVEVRVCASTANPQAVLRFFNERLVGAAWQPSGTFPYANNAASACGDPYCWRKVDNGGIRYVSLESFSATNALSAFRLRLAVAPKPTSSITVRSGQGTTYSGYGTLTVSASCHNGEQMLGGGYYVSAVDHTYHARSSFPANPSTWSVIVHATGSTPFTLQTFVACLTANYNLGLSIVTAKGDVPAGQTLPLPVSCPAGNVAIGGGFEAGGDGNLVSTDSALSGLTGWNIVVGPSGAVSHATAYAMCAAHGVQPDTDAITRSTVKYVLHTNEDVPAGLTCAKGDWLTMGGIVMGDPSGDGHVAVSIDTYNGTDYTTWYVQGRSLDATSSHGASFVPTCVIPTPFL